MLKETMYFNANYSLFCLFSHACCIFYDTTELNMTFATHRMVSDGI